MKNYLFYIYCIIIISFFPSCVHYYYAPNQGPLLGLDHKGDIKAEGGWMGTVSSSRTKMRYSATAGYSPVNHLGIQGSFFHQREQSKESLGNLGSGRGYIAEGAIGYYGSLNKAFGKSDDLPVQVLFDSYLGYGQGKVFNFYQSGGLSEMSFHKVFLQPAFHINLEERLRISVAPRMTYLHYYEATLINNVTDEDNAHVRGLVRNNPFYIQEFCFRLETGNAWGKIFYSCALSSAPYGGISPITAQIGFQFDVDEIFSKKEK